MNRGTILIFLLLFISACCRQPADPHWEISYHRVAYFLGNVDIRIGTDSCYYLNQGGIYKNPPVIRWKSSKSRLDELYGSIRKIRFRDHLPGDTAVKEDPLGSLRMTENGKLIFEVTKQQLNRNDIHQFDTIVVMLRSFASSEMGWKY